MRCRFTCLIAICLLLYASTAHAQGEWRARIVDVADADTVTAEPVNGGDRVKIRYTA
jgi:hypothetical protein